MESYLAQAKTAQSQTNLLDFRISQFLREKDFLRKTILACSPMAQMGSINGKKYRSKISWHCPFNEYILTFGYLWLIRTTTSGKYRVNSRHFLEIFINLNSVLLFFIESFCYRIFSKLISRLYLFKPFININFIVIINI